MNKRSIIFILIYLSTLTISVFGQEPGATKIAPTIGTTTQFSAVYTYGLYQAHTNQHYADENYKKAFDGYRRLAKVNDKFSQYRLAFMYAFGLGIKPDPHEAFAWSWLARENQSEDHDQFQQVYEDFHRNVAAVLTAKEIEQSKVLAREHQSNFGTFSVSHRARKIIRQEKRKCTGTLTGGGCELVNTSPFTQSPSGDRFAGFFGNNGACDIRPGRPPSNKCLLFGSVGLPGVTGVSYQRIHFVLDEIDQRLDRYNPGSVELRELEVIEADTFDDG